MSKDTQRAKAAKMMNDCGYAWGGAVPKNISLRATPMGGAALRSIKSKPMPVVRSRPAPMPKMDEKISAPPAGLTGSKAFAKGGKAKARLTKSSAVRAIKKMLTSGPAAQDAAPPVDPGAAPVGLGAIGGPPMMPPTGGMKKGGKVSQYAGLTGSKAFAKGGRVLKLAKGGRVKKFDDGGPAFADKDKYQDALSSRYPTVSDSTESGSDEPAREPSGDEDSITITGRKSAEKLPSRHRSNARVIKSPSGPMNDDAIAAWNKKHNKNYAGDHTWSGYAKGGPVEGSAKDTAEDKKQASKRGMSLKKWEASPQDAKHDKQESGMRKGGRVLPDSVNKGTKPNMRPAPKATQGEPMKNGGKPRHFAAGGAAKVRHGQASSSGAPLPAKVKSRGSLARGG